MNKFPQYPVPVVGSVLRYITVSRVVRNKHNGRITDEEFDTIADEAVSKTHQCDPIC